jgi:membrane protein YdbS with pleckstrin-like domain
VREKAVWRGSPDLAAFYGFYAVGALILALTALAAAAAGLPWLWCISLPFSILMFALPPLFRRAWRYTVTGEVIRSEFSLVIRRALEAPARSVTNVVVSQGPIERLLRVGEVRFLTAGAPGAGLPPQSDRMEAGKPVWISFWGVRDPERLARKLRPLLARA